MKTNRIPFALFLQTSPAMRLWMKTLLPEPVVPATNRCGMCTRSSITGTTGSGKSVFIHNLIAGLVCKKSAKGMRFVFIDPKMVELAAYKNLPHLACPVISDVKTQAQAVRHRLVAEVEHRYDMRLPPQAP